MMRGIHVQQTYDRGMEAHGGTSRGKLRPKGSIETLSSGSLRVRVYSGIDQLSRRKLYLTEVIPAGPDAQDKAEKVRDEFVKQVEEGRQPTTDASITQMIDRYLDEWDKSDAFHGTLLGYQRNHVNPLIGETKARRFGPDEQDKFYRELKRCRAHCDGRPFIRHRTTKAHDCDHRCAPHECVGLGATTIRHIHFLLSGAYQRAKRWTCGVPTFATTPRFQRDFRKLDSRDQQRFEKVVREQFVPDLALGLFRPGLRVKGLESAPGVYEMTWAPDGRATWQYGPEQRPGEPHVIWRRVGTHDVFKDA